MSSQSCMSQVILLRDNSCDADDFVGRNDLSASFPLIIIMLELVMLHVQYEKQIFGVLGRGNEKYDLSLVANKVSMNAL